VSGNRIDQAFDRLRSARRRGLIPFLAAGDPSLACTAALVREFAARGADVIELGVPFSDPLADGVVNQRAYQRALASGATLPRILDLVAEVRRDCDKLIIFPGAHRDRDSLVLGNLHREGPQSRRPDAKLDAAAGQDAGAEPEAPRLLI